MENCYNRQLQDINKGKIHTITGDIHYENEFKHLPISPRAKIIA